MSNPFGTFDFGQLDNAEFREDSVREELVVPLLSSLGYSASPPHQIRRSVRLQHPFVYIGTIKKSITIIPDYLLQRNSENAWILDAKSPDQEIQQGKNVEQAYSYAIHKDVRVPYYALCNGHRLVVFHISKGPAVIDIPLIDIRTVWGELLDLLGTRSAWPAGIRPGFLPDFGLALLKSGLAVDETTGKPYAQMFTSIPVQNVGKAADGLYIISGLMCVENTPTHLITFDITASQYQQFLSALEPTTFARTIADALSVQPYKIHLTAEAPTIEESVLQLPTVAVVGQISGRVITNENESYLPLTVEAFF